MPIRDENQDLFEESRMSFGEHLEELRVVLIRSLIGVAVGCIFGAIFATDVVKILQQPLDKALAKFYINDAKNKLRSEHGYVAPEWLDTLEKRNLIPEKVQIDPRELFGLFQDFDPGFMPQVSFNQSLYVGGDFQPQQTIEMCRNWSKLTTEDPDQKSQWKSLWSLLDTGDQASIVEIGQQKELSDEFAARFVEIVNSLLSQPGIYKQSAFEQVINGSNKTWVEKLKEIELSPLMEMKVKLDAEVDGKNDPELLARMNRSLINSAFEIDSTDFSSKTTELTIWKPAQFSAQSLGATDPFMIWLKALVVTGLLIASPWVFFQLWSFVAAGLYPTEQKYIYFFLPVSLALFFAGILLAFFFVFEPVLDFLFSFNAKMGITPQPRINDWLSFVMFLPLGFGIAFQLPLVMLFINRIELVSVEAFITKWRIAVVAIFGLSMVLTPADPISMIMLAVPLTGLYFLGILFCKWLNKPTNPFQAAAAT